MEADIRICVQQAKRAKGKCHLRAKLQTIMKKLAESHFPGCIEAEAWIVRVTKQRCNEQHKEQGID